MRVRTDDRELLPGTSGSFEGVTNGSVGVEAPAR
jgi:hypothetical protein